MDERLKLHPLAKKPYEEYVAMAMLLGMVYVRTIHAFVGKDDKGLLTVGHIDADTMLPDEVNTISKRTERRELWGIVNRMAVHGK